MSDELSDRIRSVAKVDYYKKGERILNEGEVCNKAGLLVKGLVRCYYINEGKDITSRLLDDGTIITSWISYYTQMPGNEFIEALEDTVFVYVDYKDTQRIYHDFPEFNKITRLIIEHAFYLAEQRTQILRKHTAEERYRYFIKNHPSLLQRVALKQIASYLGMNEETLSRVRTKAHRSCSYNWQMSRYIQVSKRTDHRQYKYISINLLLNCYVFDLIWFSGCTSMKTDVLNEINSGLIIQNWTKFCLQFLLRSS